MKMLLDTQIALWANYDPDMIPRELIEYLQNNENEFYYSLASAWEVEIKHSIGKLPVESAAFINDCEAMGLQLLPIKKEHILYLSKIPVKKEHRDPFDRLLMAQADKEKMLLLTVNPKILSYYK